MGFARGIAWVLVAAFVCAALASNTASAFTDAEIDEIFKIFDTDKDGKVTRTEFNFAKVQVIYRDIKTDPRAGVAFEQTRVSRRFFDSIDSNHDGKLSGVEILDGLPFEAVRSGRLEYFMPEDLRRFLNSIGG